MSQRTVCSTINPIYYATKKDTVTHFKVVYTAPKYIVAPGSVVYCTAGTGIVGRIRVIHCAVEKDDPLPAAEMKAGAAIMAAAAWLIPNSVKGVRLE